MLDDIKDIFDGRKPDIIGSYRKNAVMILLSEEDSEAYIVFEERAHTLRNQPGDVCLPGGRVEEGETPNETAVRETLEELRLKEEDINLIGDMDYFVSPYGSIMYVFVAELNKSFNEIAPSTEEVHRLFRVPLKYFLENEPLTYKMEIGPRLKEDFPYHLVKGGKDYKFSRGFLNQYFYVYDENIIWGFTAMIVKSFIDIIKQDI